MLRLFAGIAIPDGICQRLALMEGGIPGARWTRQENFHLTLCFIGETDETTADIIDEVLSGIEAPAFDLQLKGVGHFAQGDDPTVLWAGVRPEEKLMALHDKVERALDRAHIQFDNRKYTPHVTLARFKHPSDDKLADFSVAHAGYESETFRVGEFILYRSHLTKNGPFYDPLIRYPLL